MPPRPRVPSELLTDDLLVRLCEGFLGEGWNANQTAEWLSKQNPPVHVGRTRVYALLGVARDRGLFRLQVRSSAALGERLAEAVGVPPERIRVASASGPNAADQVALHGAELVEGLIEERARELDEATDVAAGPEPVRVGLGGGNTLRMLAAHLARLLRRAADHPPLAIHALSSGFDPREPQNAPVTFLGAFEPIADELVGLFSSGVLEANEAARMRELPGIKESFDLAEKIDVVVTSLASAGDRKSPLNQFLARAEATGAESRARLIERGWVGDVLYEPYGEDGPIEANLPVQPVSLFTLQALHEHARRPHRAVVLVAAPTASGRSKADALVPLIEQESLRMWTHLVVDAGTAQQVLDQLGPA